MKVIEKLKDKKVLAVIFIILAVVILFFVYLSSKNEQENFDVQTILLKENIAVRGESNASVVIENKKDVKQNFKLYFEGVEDIASLDEDEFTLFGNQEKEIMVMFKDTESIVDVYIGYLVIEGSENVKKIPVVLGVGSEDPRFAIIQEPIPAYKEVYLGGKFGMEVKLFNLKDHNKHNVKLNYFLKNFDGEILIPDEESRILEETISITKMINIPENIEPADYVFVTSLENNNQTVMASYFFEITKEKKSYFGNIEYFVLVVFVFLLGMFWLLFYFFKSRDEMLLKLQRQQKVELNSNLKLIKKHKESLKGIKNVSERKKRIEQLEKKGAIVVKKIKKKQRAQKKKLKELKKKKKKQEMRKHLDVWKKEGYSMSELKSEVKGISKKGMIGELKKLSAEGYKLG